MEVGEKNGSKERVREWRKKGGKEVSGKDGGNPRKEGEGEGKRDAAKDDGHG